MGKYLENLSTSLQFVRSYMPKDDYAELCKEVNEFIAMNEGKPVSEQTKLFMSKYGEIMELAKYRRIISIDSNLFFIKIITIILLIAIPLFWLVSLLF